MIVVAGGTGTLGTSLVQRLAEAGLAVRVLTRGGPRPAIRPSATDTPT